MKLFFDGTVMCTFLSPQTVLSLPVKIPKPGAYSNKLREYSLFFHS